MNEHMDTSIILLSKMTELKDSSIGSKPRQKDKKPAATPKAMKPLTKVVVRRLPPTMTEATFLEQVQPLPEHDHMYFVAADWSMSVNATCRAYFNFLHQEDVFIFKEKFNGYIFVDAKGNEYPAIVEFAPFQRMGRVKSKKVDRKCNTYETSEYFLAFTQSMDADETTIPKLELKSDFDTKQEKQQIRMTPLLEFLNNDKKARKRGGDRDRERDRKQQQRQEKKILAPIKEDQPPAQRSTNKETSAAPARTKDGQSVAGRKERPERSEKERARRAERDKMRREKRQLQIEEKKRKRQVLKQPPRKEETAEAINTTTVTTPAAAAAFAKERRSSVGSEKSTIGEATVKKSAPKEGRKYSDRRQDQRNKKATGAAVEKRTGEGSAPAGDNNNGKEKPSGEEAAKGETKKKESRRYSERRIRNKDRPAIQIYQPGAKVRGKATNED